MKRFIFFVAILAMVVGGAGQAQAVIIGTPEPDVGNCIPFGCIGDPPYLSRYQQVYDSTSFSEPISINEINFFMTEDVGGNLNIGTYALYLSTTSKAVNGLDTVNFDNNLGADNQLFTTEILAGEAAPVTLSFTGNVFNYDPSAGNLLLDIIIEDIGRPSPYSESFLDWMVSSGGLFSRAYYGFSGATAGSGRGGLVTEFKLVPEPATMLLLGTGLVGLVGFRKKFKK